LAHTEVTVRGLFWSI